MHPDNANKGAGEPRQTNAREFERPWSRLSSRTAPSRTSEFDLMLQHLLLTTPEPRDTAEDQQMAVNHCDHLRSSRQSFNSLHTSDTSSPSPNFRTLCCNLCFLAVHQPTNQLTEMHQPALAHFNARPSHATPAATATQDTHVCDVQAQLYCETCMCVACPRCASDTHAIHRVLTHDEALNRMRGVCARLISNCSEGHALCTDLLDEMQNVTCAVSDEYHITIDRINLEWRKLFETMESLRKTIVKRTERSYDAEMAAINKRSQTICDMGEQLHKIHGFLLTKPDEPTITQTIHTYQKCLEQMRQARACYDKLYATRNQRKDTFRMDRFHANLVDLHAALEKFTRFPFGEDFVDETSPLEDITHLFEPPSQTSPKPHLEEIARMSREHATMTGRWAATPPNVTYASLLSRNTEVKQSAIKLPSTSTITSGQYMPPIMPTDNLMAPMMPSENRMAPMMPLENRMVPMMSSENRTVPKITIEKKMLPTIRPIEVSQVTAALPASDDFLSTIRNHRPPALRSIVPARSVTPSTPLQSAQDSRYASLNPVASPAPSNSMPVTLVDRPFYSRAPKRATLSFPLCVKTPIVIGGVRGNGEGQLSRPWGVCTDFNGFIYVSDRSNDRIQVFDPQGKFVRMFGCSGEGPGQFTRPAGICIDNRQRLIVADKDNHRIQMLSLTGTFIMTFGRRGRRNGEFHYPWDVDCNSFGTIAVTDTRNQRIQVFNPEGEFIGKFGFYMPNDAARLFAYPRSVSFSCDEFLITTDFNKNRLVVINQRFEMERVFCLSEGAQLFHRPQGVVVDGNGIICVSDSRNNRVTVLEASGVVKETFKDIPGHSPAILHRPCGINLTPDGRIVVVDFGNDRVIVF